MPSIPQVMRAGQHYPTRSVGLEMTNSVSKLKVGKQTPNSNQLKGGVGKIPTRYWDISLVPYKRIIKFSFNITSFVKTCNFMTVYTVQIARLPRVS